MEAAPESHTQHMEPGIWSRKGTAVFALFVGLPAAVFWLVFVVVLLSILSMLDGEGDRSCNIATIPVYGVITSNDDGFAQLLGFGALTGARSLIKSIETAEQNSTVHAMVIDIDSPGGTPVAADDVARALQNTSKPTVALIRDLGASAAYWVAAGTDHIVASPISAVGSIGVTMSYVELAGANEEEGSRWIDLSSGSFKDAGNPDRTLAEDEHEYLQVQVDAVHDYMLKRITNMRPLLSVEEHADISDGRMFLGEQGSEIGLVDTVGGELEVRTYLAEQLNMPINEVVLCDVPSSGIEALFE